MACLALFARSTHRTYAALRALLLVLLLMLAWNPLYLAFDPGFEFSFAATLGLILGAPILIPRLLWIKNPFLREIVATTVAAQVAVLPLLLWQTGNLSLVALPANILVMLVIPLAMALSFIAGLIGVIVPFIAPAVGIPAHLLLSYIVAVASYGAALPFAHVVLPAFPFALVVVLYALLFWLLKRLERNAPSTPSPYRIELHTRSS
jgi:competence protein ComEC